MMRKMLKRYLKKTIFIIMRFNRNKILIIRLKMILKIQTVDQKMSKAQDAFIFARKNSE
jgi:hypothetical protein